MLLFIFILQYYEYLNNFVFIFKSNDKSLYFSLKINFSGIISKLL